MPFRVIDPSLEYCFLCPHRIHLEKEQTFGSELNFVLGRKCDQIWRFFKVLGEKIVKKVAQIYIDFWAIWKHHFSGKNRKQLLGQLLDDNGLLFTAASGHTVGRFEGRSSGGIFSTERDRVTRLGDFLKFIVSRFLLKLTQMYGAFWALWKHLFSSKNCCRCMLGIFGKLLISTSGHTA